MKLGTFSENDDEFVGSVAVAELYMELRRYEQAVEWFEKEWSMYYKSPDWVKRFVFCLVQTNRIARANEIANECIKQNQEERDEVELNGYGEDWTEREKEEYLSRLLHERQEFERMVEDVLSGHMPAMKFATSIRTGCYLFGCNRHNNPEYHER
ncbi:hypothetical protein D3C84_860570 [compost metagenome]